MLGVELFKLRQLPVGQGGDLGVLISKGMSPFQGGQAQCDQSWHGAGEGTW